MPPARWKLFISIIQQPQFQERHTRLLYCLIDQADEDGWCRTKQIILSIDAKHSRPTIRNYLAQLANLGFIEIRRIRRVWPPTPDMTRLNYRAIPPTGTNSPPPDISLPPSGDCRLTDRVVAAAHETMTPENKRLAEYAEIALKPALSQLIHDLIARQAPDGLIRVSHSALIRPKRSHGTVQRRLRALMADHWLVQVAGPLRGRYGAGSVYRLNYRVIPPTGGEV